tara:strand:+ start:1469 stop:1906 length:438 start_codon:yes stop_codon:yes gene_type:complete
MNYAIIDGTTVKSTGTIQQLFPNTSFSIGGPNADFLSENNVVELVENLSYTTPTQKLSIVDAYVQDGKAYNVRVENTTAEEQTALTDQKWIAIRLERNRRLQITDWRASSDLTLSDDWKTYRQALRDVPTQTDPYNITWPTEPSS